MNTLTSQKEQTQNGRTPAQQEQPKRRYLYPHVNIEETKDGYILEAEMPGVSKEGLEVQLEGNELTIIGHRKTPLENATCVYRESTLADYHRKFELDPAIDTAKISARMENGILHLTLPKAEQVKPRRITIE